MDGNQGNPGESQIVSKPLEVDQVQLASSRATATTDSPASTVIQQLPVLRAQGSSAAPSVFQGTAPGVSSLSTNSSSHTSAASSNSAAVAGHASPTNGENSASASNVGGNTVILQHQPAMTISSVPSVPVSGSDSTVASVTVPPGAPVSTLPNGQYFFMVPNSVPTIAPRPGSSSEAMPSPPVVTAAVRADGSPVALVQAAPMGGELSPTLPSLKRPRAGSPRETKRRAIHNEVERRRRDRINLYMDQLKEIVPSSPMACSHNSKGHVLEKAVVHITELKGRIDVLQDEVAAVHRRYQFEHDQLLQCASQHSLLRQQLLDSSLKPAFGTFKIGTQASAALPPVDKVGGSVRVSVPTGVIATHTTSVQPSAVSAAPTAMPIAQTGPPPMESLSSLSTEAAAGGSDSQPSSPPALTVVTLSAPLHNHVPDQQA